MTGLTNISDRLTPSTPMELTFGAQPTATGRKFTTLVGRMAAVPGSASAGDVHQVTNVGNSAKALLEIAELAGDDSEIGEMVEAFIDANQKVSTGARSTYPALRVLMLANAATDLGVSGASLDPVRVLRNDFIVSPFAAENSTELGKVRDFAVQLSGADRDLRGQFGTVGVVASLEAPEDAVDDIDPDTAYLCIPVLPDSGGSPAQVVGVVAAGAAGVLAGNLFPYNPVDNVEIGGMLRPVADADLLVNDPAGATENMLVAGLMPLVVDAHGKVRICRARNARTSVEGDGAVAATSYLDVQDLQVAFDYREDVYNVLQTAPFKNKKATAQQAEKVGDKVIDLAMEYEKETAFQNVKALAKAGGFKVVVSTTQRGRFDFKLPVDVTPGNHVIAGNIELTDLFSFTL